MPEEQAETEGLQLSSSIVDSISSCNNSVTPTSLREGDRNGISCNGRVTSCSIIDFLFFVDENKLKDKSRLQLVVYLLFAPFISRANASTLLKISRQRLTEIINTTPILKKKLVEIPGWQCGGREARIKMTEEGQLQRDYILALADRILDRDEINEIIHKSLKREKLAKAEKVDLQKYLDETLKIIRRKMLLKENCTLIASTRSKKLGIPFKDLMKMAKGKEAPPTTAHEVSL